MYKSLIICLVLCGFLGSVQEPNKDFLQNDSTSAGLYRIRLKGDENYEHALIVLLRRRGNEVELLDLATNAKLKGKEIRTTANEVVFFFEFPDEWRNLQTWQGVPTKGLELRRKKMSRQFTAHLVTPVASVPELVVEGLLSVWACSNHNNPTHTADSQTQMRDLTAKYGCTGWHKLSLGRGEVAGTRRRGEGRCGHHSRRKPVRNS